MNTLPSLGWTPALDAAFAAHRAARLLPARVAAQTRGRYRLLAEPDDFNAELTGRLRHDTRADALPVVGDWVAIRPETARIEAVLPRRTAFARATGDLTRIDLPATRQTIAANIDLVLIVTGADADFSVRRLERLLTIAWGSGAQPAIALTKIDLLPDPAPMIATLAESVPGVPVLPLSNATGLGIDAVRAAIGQGRTALMMGSSGVGKSSLANRLLGTTLRATSATDANGRGRHTTTCSDLLRLPGGGLLIDTPGIRVVTPAAGSRLGAAFADVDGLAQGCRFHDCRHESEPGCAVKAAIESGDLAPDRFRGFAKLRREAAYADRRDDKRTLSEQKRVWRARTMANRRRAEE